MLKKIITGFILIFALCIMFPIRVSANEVKMQEAREITDFENEIPGVIRDNISAINQKDWAAWVQTYSPRMQKYLEGFPAQYLIEERRGLLSVDSIEIFEAKELPPEHILELEPYFSEIDLENFENVRYFYIGYLYEVCRETEYYYNGVMYTLRAVGCDNNREYIIGEENVYFLERYKKFGYEFGSDEERMANNIIQARRQGIIINFSGELIETDRWHGTESSQSETILNFEAECENTEQMKSDKGERQETEGYNISDEQREREERALEEADQGRWGVSTRSAENPPDKIRLYLTGKDQVKTLGFDEYTKCVLPNEWIPSWDEKALKAGAIAIKTYAWYNAENRR